MEPHHFMMTFKHVMSTWNQRLVHHCLLCPMITSTRSGNLIPLTETLLAVQLHQYVLQGHFIEVSISTDSNLSLRHLQAKGLPQTTPLLLHNCL